MVDSFKERHYDAFENLGEIKMLEIFGLHSRV